MELTKEEGEFLLQVLGQIQVSPISEKAAGTVLIVQDIARKIIEEIKEEE